MRKHAEDVLRKITDELLDKKASISQQNRRQSEKATTNPPLLVDKSFSGKVSNATIAQRVRRQSEKAAVNPPLLVNSYAAHVAAAQQTPHNGPVSMHKYRIPFFTRLS